jgi:hypothetical protein
MNVEDEETEEFPKRRELGRKPARESRAAELRQRLIAWRQAPESLRPSLRALAGELGTSHQLLKHYLDGLEEWQCQERCRRTKEKAEEIQARAKTEGRAMTVRECIDSLVTPKLFDQIESMRQDFKRGPLDPHQIKMLKVFAENFPEAQELLQKLSQIKPEWKKVELPPEQKRLMASLPKDQARRYERWIHDCSRGKGYDLCLDRRSRIIR